MKESAATELQTTKEKAEVELQTTKEKAAGELAHSRAQTEDAVEKHKVREL
jgi:hypothetical protein